MDWNRTEFFWEKNSHKWRLFSIRPYAWGDENPPFWELFSQENTAPFYFSKHGLILIFYNMLIAK